MMRLIQILFLFFVFPVSVFAGWVITEESTDSFGNRLIQTTFIQDNLIRHETPSSIAIIDLNNEIITIIFSQYRVYWSGTTSELKLSTVEMYDNQLEEMLVGLPEYKRKELDSIYLELRNKMLDSADNVVNRNVTIVETDIEEDLLGYNTIKYNIVVDSVIKESVWHTTAIKPYNDIDINNMISFMRHLDQHTGQGSIPQANDYLNLLRNGMLLKSIEYLPNGNTYETAVSNIREVNISSDFFLPPENYRKASLSDILNLMPVDAGDD